MCHALMLTNRTDVDLADQCGADGATDWITKGDDPYEVREDIVSRLSEGQKTDEEFVPTEREKACINCPSDEKRAVLIRDITSRRVKRGAFISGPAGSGKNHAGSQFEASLPKGTPWIRVNAGAIESSLAASELFGHAKGAFTGAGSAKAGLFEQANGGWIFLDEIANIDMKLQKSLLTVVEEGIIRRVGTTNPVKLDVCCKYRFNTAVEGSLSESRRIYRFF